MPASSAIGPVAVVGLGYVGLPLALAFAEKGIAVIGVDTDPSKVEALSQGRSYIGRVKDDLITALSGNGLFTATGEMAAASEARAIAICVPTLLDKHQTPDLSYVIKATESLIPHLRSGQLISLESTTYPGTTTELVKPILERAGLAVGTDIFLGFSPEREDPGNPDFTITNVPKVIGADDDASRARMEELYAVIAPSLVPVASSATAEAVKLTENIFRMVNIALVNELKVVYERMGIDIWEVIDAAKTKPFGFMPFYPGPGLGGHCIPIDPHYLTWKAREFNVSARFVELAGKINSQMPDYVVANVALALDQRLRKGLFGAKILIVGMSYKRNVGDLRESPSLIVREILVKRGAEVAFHDPLISVFPAMLEHPDLEGEPSVALTPKALACFNAVVICTDHDDVDYDLLAEHAPLIIDTRNVYGRMGKRPDGVVMS